MDFLERLLARRAAMWLGTTSGVISPNPLVRWLLSIGGREIDFKLMDLIPLGVSSPALRNREKL
jgi:hypothetical protein